ncbi:hypothetical protein BDV36DRAFT_80334 [Aspergillus pseudocaelatus]|uniref:Uncharacterized protein n=1 Tax=Aspergillus pseudocaelatus TaxID=1825620 RepID=A0ABQ6WVE0_9EURO|nr:hypothetical protein BDV36DRAFT_80334 [Aspergillus pseudocaelatus]
MFSPRRWTLHRVCSGPTQEQTTLIDKYNHNVLQPIAGMANRVFPLFICSNKVLNSRPLCTSHSFFFFFFSFLFNILVVFLN